MLTYTHPFPIHVQLVRHWLMDQLHMDVWTRTPNDMTAILPVVKVGGSPSGWADGYTRSASIDIDLFTASQGDMDRLSQQADMAMLRLAGNGNSYGYVDDVTGGSFAAVDYGDPDLLRYVATYSLTMRPTAN
ncbi:MULTISPECIES: hypothetical protein [Bifidobacterium]|jgi:hypothetical protein|uniref:DUF3168 domain-containing protein n=1 Tax=Bifidobacterium tibiigranuli TaxID=2172043 RepID=A0A5N6S8V0_9BIFI|nr:hypothetical protein [Bifidobacterium tibiigranuli]KAE8130214.1 hypothetical protein DDE84_01150 [Bifidobacterium tibiigranuli]KAE8130427.1 hypothetical protein DDF78_00505 [Bifidobacterium tibiigranuli]MCI1212100.1 hypothetical protein [Bifidobacterium tibiigranuli]